MQLTLAHNVPSLRAVPEKYNLITRLWLNCFRRPLEILRRCASDDSIVALEHLQGFTYYAYTFYSCLFEEESLSAYRSSWVESLGDLARYRMAISELVTSKASSASLTQSAVSRVADSSNDITVSISADDTKASQFSNNSVLPKGNSSESSGVGIEAARAMELLPEREKWRKIAMEWYSNGLIEYPGTGKLHHHMGFLCRGEGDELRALYHFIKRYAPASANSPHVLTSPPQHDNTPTLPHCPGVHPCSMGTVCSAAPFFPGSSRI